MYVFMSGIAITLSVATVFGFIAAEYGIITGLTWALGIIIFGVIISLFVSILPLEGYHKTKESHIHLITIQRNTKEDKSYYLEKKGNAVVFAVNACDEYSLKGEAYKEVKVRGKIKIYETSGDTEPSLKEFVTIPKRSESTWSEFFTKREYVFFVPKEAILNDSKENIKENIVTLNINFSD